MTVGALVLMFVDRHAVLPSAASSDHWNFANVLNLVVNLAALTFGIVLAVLAAALHGRIFAAALLVGKLTIPRSRSTGWALGG